MAYCVLPCVLKLAAAALLYARWLRQPSKDRRMRPTTLLPGGAGLRLLVLGGCAAPDADDYAAEKPVLDLTTLLQRHARSRTACSPTASGKVQRRFIVQMKGTWQGNEGVLDEDFTYSDGKTRSAASGACTQAARRPLHRHAPTTWSARPRAGRRQCAALALHAAPAGRRHAYEVQFDDWMYLMDERVMLNKAVMSKFGIRLGEVTLSFYASS